MRAWEALVRGPLCHVRQRAPAKEGVDLKGGPCSKTHWMLCGGRGVVIEGVEGTQGKKEAEDGVTWSLLFLQLLSSRLLEEPCMERRVPLAPAA